MYHKIYEFATNIIAFRILLFTFDVVSINKPRKEAHSNGCIILVLLTMNIEDVREYCISIKGAEECFPFDETTLVFKVMGKMFAYIGLEYKDEGFMLNLKCDPEKAVELRERYSCVIPGYHSNKKYWNSIFIEKGMPDDELKYWINHSVDEVLKKLSKKQQTEYAALKNKEL